jgi:F-type H+-transporting ATPase subunit epsilon
VSSLAALVVDPEKIAWQGEASQVILGLSDGLAGILPGHADAVFALAPQITRIDGSDGKQTKLFISGGIARVEKGKLTVVADSAEFPDQIDRQRAEKAKERAENRLSQSDRKIDYDRARLALMRALLRLDLAK